MAGYNGSGSQLKRYVHGPGTDEPVAVYNGSTQSLASRRYMLADERGSIAALVNADGSPSVINIYDEYGIPGAANDGRFQYTGQAWIPELGMYHYKARLYSPTLGRFLQVDPIGYDDQINLYAYVGDDPVNHADPAGKRIKWVFQNGGTRRHKSDTLTYLGRSDAWRRKYGMAVGTKAGTLTIIVDQTSPHSALRNNDSIMWNPLLATKLADGQITSPAITLGHELDHGVRQIKDREQYKIDSNTPTDNGQSNVNEDKATSFAGTVSKELNEPVQERFADGEEEVLVPHPTSHSPPK